MNSNYVWYVCYGSNLLEDRFLHYILGGCLPDSGYVEKGARDHTLPIASEPCVIDNILFFSGRIERWFGSGVAFIGTNCKEDLCTYARRYLITEEQFYDVVRQENLLDMDATISFDKKKLTKEGSVILFDNDYYGRMLYLGELDGYPMYTFTCVLDEKEMQKTIPFGAYYDIIARGLRETHNLNDNEIKEYFIKRTNFSNNS